MSVETRRESPWGALALALVGVGWLVAVVLGDGFELHRSALAMPFVVAGSLCGLVEVWRSGRTMWGPALVVGAAAVCYFAARSILSPVWDLGRQDLHLVALGWLTLATVASAASSRRRIVLLVVLLVVVFLAQLAAGLYQRLADPEWVLFRLARRTSGGVSGLFWHWNNLAAFLAIVLPLFLGVALATRRLPVRILFLLLVMAGLLLAYLSKSRAGFAVVVVGMGSVGVLLLVWRSREWSWGGRLAVFTSVGVLGMIAAVAVFAIASRVSEDRGYGADLSQALGKNSRLALAGMAFDQWIEAPLVGQGSQSFRYLAVKNWDYEMWLGNPETVHNEYLQVLADYGLFGFLLVMGFIVSVLGRTILAPSAPDEDPWRRGLRVGAAGALVATLAHATVEFQLHLLPILVLAAAGVGFLVQAPARGSKWALAGHTVLVLLAASLAVAAVGRENRAAPKWLAWQRAVVSSRGSLEPSDLVRLKELVALSPHYEPALHYARLRYDQYIVQAEGERDESLLEEAARALEVAATRNPFDQTTLVTRALVLDELGRHEEATAVHVRAVEMAARRENKYGAMAGMAMNLLHRGEALWMQRNPEAALGYFLLARDYLEASRRAGFKFGGDEDAAGRRQAIGDRITLLQESGITPQSPPDVQAPPNE